MTGIGHNGGPKLCIHRDGWVAVARAMRDHAIVGFHLHAKPADANRGAMQPALAFIDLIMECRYEDGTVMNGGRKMILRRGELIGAISWLAARWNWTPKAVRGWLDRLEADGMIARFQRSSEGVETGLEKGNQKGNRAAMLRLCNYDIYQSATVAEGQSNQQSRGNQGAIEGQSKGNIYKDNKGTREQGNNETIEEEDIGLTASVADAPPPAELISVADDSETIAEPVDAKREAAIRSGVEVLAAFQAYNALAQEIGLPVARSLTPARRKAIAARMKDHGGVDAWQSMLDNIQRSDFLQGRNDRGWRPDLDWLTLPRNFTKVVENGYPNRPHDLAPIPASSAQETSWGRMAKAYGVDPISLNIEEFHR